jgi:hypothetical protein
VRLYDADANVLKGEFAHPGPVLDCCFHDDSSGFSAGADHTVRRSTFLLSYLYSVPLFELDLSNRQKGFQRVISAFNFHFQ